MKWKDARRIISSNPEVKQELINNEAEYEIIREIIQVRKDKNLTQKDLSTMIGTHQSNISHLESGNYNPSLEFLNKIARALGKHLEIKLNKL